MLAEGAQRPVSSAIPTVVVGAGAEASFGAPSHGVAEDARFLGSLLARHFEGVELREEWLGRRARKADILGAVARAAREAPASCLVFAGFGTGLGDHPPGLLLDAEGEPIGPADLAEAVRLGGGDTLQIVADVGFAAMDRDRAPGRSAPPALARRWSPGQTAPLRGELRWLCAASPGGEAYTHEGRGLFTDALGQLLQASSTRITAQRLAGRLYTRVQRLMRERGLPWSQRPWASPRGAGRLLLGQEAAPAPVAVHHQVPLVGQLTGMSCWAAAAAMVVGWRDHQSVDGPGIARGARRWKAFERGLLPSDVDLLAEAWRLQVETPRVWTVGELAALMTRVGPLWVGEADPDLHVVVIASLEGDGTPDGTDVEVLDPWPIGRGERYTLTFRELMENFHAASRMVGLHAQLLHSGGRHP